jgi:hypothetical protein
MTLPTQGTRTYDPLGIDYTNIHSATNAFTQEIRRDNR